MASRDGTAQSKRPGSMFIPYTTLRRLINIFIDTAFKQQRLKAWQPILTPKPVILSFLIIGIVFIPIGAGIVYSSNKVYPNTQICSYHYLHLHNNSSLHLSCNYMYITITTNTYKCKCNSNTRRSIHHSSHITHQLSQSYYYCYHAFIPSIRVSYQSSCIYLQGLTTTTGCRGGPTI